MVSWDPPRGQDVVNYDVLYQPLQTFGGAIRSQAVNVNMMSVVLISLEEYVTYNISVRAYTSEGVGPFSSGVVQGTDEDGEKNS